jgi:glutathione S-transferase
MCESVILIRYETWLRPEPLRWPVWINEHWSKIHTGLGWFEANAAELEGPVNVAHLALGCMLGYADFRWPDHGWRKQFPGVAAWFARLEQRPSFAQTRPEAPPG